MDRAVRVLAGRAWAGKNLIVISSECLANTQLGALKRIP
jgi:hypothetical protein